MALNPSRIFRRLQRNIVCHLTLRSRWCSSLLRPAAPIRLRNYPCASSPACRLIVFLPGIGDILEDYEFYGFIDAIRQCRISADMIAADYERRLWLWLKSYDSQSPTFPRLYLGYGMQDKFASANQLLADRLPGAHVHRIPRKHDWPTWIRLWHAILAQIEPSSAACRDSRSA